MTGSRLARGHPRRAVRGLVAVFIVGGALVACTPSPVVGNEGGASSAPTAASSIPIITVTPSATPPTTTPPASATPVRSVAPSLDATSSPTGAATGTPGVTVTAVATATVARTPPPLPPATTASYPLRLSGDRRFLVDQTGAPFLMVGDSPQALIGDLSPAEAEFFFANRRAAGFNAAWVNLLCADYTGCNANATTYDGIAPLRTPGDLSTPNEAYFARADTDIRLAAKYGIVLLLDPIETGSWLKILRANGPAKSRAFGQYLGARYRGFPNIIWMSGNDFQSWRDAADDAVVLAVAQGIKDADPDHLQTIELDYYVSASQDDARWAPLLGLDAAYTYAPTYAEVLKEYDRGRVPVFMVEANYEFEHDYSGPKTLRRQEYWAMLSGATGQLYGNKYTWQFIAGWREHLDTVGSQQLGYLTRLFAGRSWPTLAPDERHILVTGGYGTLSASGNVNDNDYATAAGTPDGSLVVAYLPTARSITVNMSALAGPAVAWWYDPTRGTYLAVAGSPLDNRGARTFTPPGRNGDGDDDWVLVLETG